MGLMKTYDPERSLDLERKLVEDQAGLSRVEARLGESHPWTQRVRLVTDILEIIVKKENDLVDYFDKIKQESIQLEIDKLIKIAYDTLEV